MTPADIAALRARLLELQGKALAQLIAAVPIIDAGMLRLVADIRATLAVLDAEHRRWTHAPAFMRTSAPACVLWAIQTQGGRRKHPATYLPSRFGPPYAQRTPPFKSDF